MGAGMRLHSVVCSGLMIVGLALLPVAAAGAPPLVVSSGDLARAFATDRAAAEKTYINQWVKVTGTVDTVSEDALGRPRVVFQQDSSIIYCSFPAEAKKGWHALRKGAQATIVGRLKGKGYYRQMILIEDCYQP